jgi:small subunit ribosomal protein S3
LEAEVRQSRRERPVRRPRSGSTGTTTGGTEAGRAAAASQGRGRGRAAESQTDAAQTDAPQTDGDEVLATAPPEVANAVEPRSADLTDAPAQPVAGVDSSESTGGPAVAGDQPVAPDDSGTALDPSTPIDLGNGSDTSVEGSPEAAPNAEES